jgi:hypothetical protein
MRFRRTSQAQLPAQGEAPRRRLGKPGPRGMAVAAGAAVALAGAVAGVAVIGSPGAATGTGAHGLGTHGSASSRAATSGTGGGGTGHQSSGNRAARAAGAAKRPGGYGSAAASARLKADGPGQGRAQGHGSAQPPALTARTGPGALRTSCRSVAHIGDSTSADLISAASLPNQAQQLPARYAGVGVKHLHLDASGGRSVVEALLGQVNGYNVARAWRDQGYHGCWVFALGTNDAANVAVGSSVGLMARINEMMSVAHGQPVMWVSTRTLLPTGYWSSANEQHWDKTLVRALARYPNMRIFDWSAVAQPSWFLPDGIHYNSLGCAMRAKAIADALARAFPLGGHSKGQIVR